MLLEDSDINIIPLNQLLLITQTREIIRKHMIQSRTLKTSNKIFKPLNLCEQFASDDNTAQQTQSEFKHKN